MNDDVEALVLRHTQQHVGAPVAGEQLGVRDDVGEGHRVGDVEVGGELVQRAPVEPGALPADERQPRARIVVAQP